MMFLFCQFIIFLQFFSKNVLIIASIDKSLHFLSIPKENVKFSKKDEPITHQAARLLQIGIANIFSTSSTYSYHNNNNQYIHDIDAINNPSKSIVLKSPYGTFKSYCPETFTLLRQFAGISDNTYITSLHPDNLICISSDSKSGSAFWKSKDGNLVLKTIKHYEVKNLLRILPLLASHLTQNSLSTIASILGLYRIQLRNGKKVYFLIAKNVYPSTVTNTNRLKLYDLKGSTIGRIAKGDSIVMKDVNLMQSNQLLQLGHAKSFLLQALERDVLLLEKCNFMDYSLLVAIEENAASNSRRFTNRLLLPISNSLHDRGKFVCLGSDGLIYHFGIIDFLQT